MEVEFPGPGKRLDPQRFVDELHNAGLPRPTHVRQLSRRQRDGVWSGYDDAGVRVSPYVVLAFRRGPTAAQEADIRGMMAAHVPPRIT
jgi:hypothetical protein